MGVYVIYIAVIDIIWAHMLYILQLHMLYGLHINQTDLRPCINNKEKSQPLFSQLLGKQGKSSGKTTARDAH